MKKFIITESEKNRILGMHKSATKRQYLSEGSDGRLPEWARNQKMNFYRSENEDDEKPERMVIDRLKPQGFTGLGGEVTFIGKHPEASSIKFELEFSCMDQNEKVGLFYIVEKDDLKDGLATRHPHFNKKIAEKYFIPEYCSKSSGGKWVPKVDNPDFAKVGGKELPNGLS